MWLKLDLEDIDFRFRISQYKKSTRENWDEEWCTIDLTLKAQEWLNYNILADECLLSIEVERLCDKIDDLLNDKLDEPETITCIEPDFEFTLSPKEDIRNNPSVVYIRPGSEVIVDVDMEFTVSFWDKSGALTSNRLILVFCRKDLEKLLCYLKYITGAITEEDETLRKFIAEGIICKE